MFDTVGAVSTYFIIIDISIFYSSLNVESS